MAGYTTVRQHASLCERGEVKGNKPPQPKCRGAALLYSESTIKQSAANGAVLSGLHWDCNLRVDL